MVTLSFRSVPIQKLARSLREFQHRMAVIGGSHKLWGVDEKFDEYVLTVTQIMTKEGVIVDNNAYAYCENLEKVPTSMLLAYGQFGSHVRKFPVRRL